MAITLAQAQAHLDAWMAADLGLAEAASYSISTPQGYRTLTRADAAEVRQNITMWQRMVKQLNDEADGITNGGFKIATFT